MSKVKGPTLKKKNKFKSKKDKTQKKSYVAWDDNEIWSPSGEGHANKTLMASHHSIYEEYEVSDYEIDDKPSYDELQNIFHELHEEFLKLSRQCSK